MTLIAFLVPPPPLRHSLGVPALSPSGQVASIRILRFASCDWLVGRGPTHLPPCKPLGELRIDETLFSRRNLMISEAFRPIGDQGCELGSAQLASGSDCGPSLSLTGCPASRGRLGSHTCLTVGCAACARIVRPRVRVCRSSGRAVLHSAQCHGCPASRGLLRRARG